jgi:hypothetical protein
MVIVYDGWNDVKLSDNEFSKVSNLKLDEQITVSKSKKLFYDIQEIFYQFKTHKFIMKLYSSINTGDKQDSSDLVNHQKNEKEIIKQWKSRLDRICEIGYENNISTVIILQPLLGTSHRNLTLEEKQNFEKENHPSIIQSYEKFGDELTHMSNKCTLKEDFREVFNDVDIPLFFDTGHIGVEAKKIVANQIYEKTIPIIMENNTT